MLGCVCELVRVEWSGLYTLVGGQDAVALFFHLNWLYCSTSWTDMTDLMGLLVDLRDSDCTSHRHFHPREQHKLKLKKTTFCPLHAIQTHKNEANAEKDSSLKELQSECAWMHVCVYVASELEKQHAFTRTSLLNTFCIREFTLSSGPESSAVCLKLCWRVQTEPGRTYNTPVSSNSWVPPFVSTALLNNFMRNAESTVPACSLALQTRTRLCSKQQNRLNIILKINWKLYICIHNIYYINI